MSLLINTREAIDKYLVFKYACFNKPEQDYIVTPFIKEPFENVEACEKYNRDLKHFMSLSLDVRVKMITSPNQSYLVEQTLDARLYELFYQLTRFARMWSTHREMSQVIPSVQNMLVYCNAMPAKKRVILLHLLDIYFCDNSMRYAYPFFATVVNQVQFDQMHERFLTSFFQFSMFNVDIGDQHNPMHVIFDVLCHVLLNEQWSPSGIHISLDKYDEEDEEEAIRNRQFQDDMNDVEMADAEMDDDESKHNTAFVANDEEAAAIRKRLVSNSGSTDVDDEEEDDEDDSLHSLDASDMIRRMIAGLPAREPKRERRWSDDDCM